MKSKYANLVGKFVTCNGGQRGIVLEVPGARVVCQEYPITVLIDNGEVHKLRRTDFTVRSRQPKFTVTPTLLTIEDVQAMHAEYEENNHPDGGYSAWAHESIAADGMITDYEKPLLLDKAEALLSAMMLLFDSYRLTIRDSAGFASTCTWNVASKRWDIETRDGTRWYVQSLYRLVDFHCDDAYLSRFFECIEEMALEPYKAVVDIMHGAFGITITH